MAGAVRVESLGGPEVLRWVEMDVPAPGPGELRIRHTAVGLNFIDVYYRTGVYTGPEPPFVLGFEAAGVVQAVGEGVEGFAPGDRVAYGQSPIGAYAEERLVPASRVVHLPEAVDERQAAALMLKGMTAQYLLRSTYRVRADETILIHAAAGGVGLIACQWARHLGARVIGTVSSTAKAELAAAHGCDHPIVTTRDDPGWVEHVLELTDGRGVPVVYDSVGKDTFEGSLDCLAPRGLLVSFGQSSGKVPPFSVNILSGKGSLYVTRPTLGTYTASRADLEAVAAEVFDVVARGAVRIEIGQTFALRDAAEAHRALEGRRTMGSSVLLP